MTGAPPRDCLLTLAVPLALEDEIVEVLTRQAPSAQGFTVSRGHAAGAGIPLDHAIDRVRGRAGRVFIQVALGGEDAQALLDALERELPRARITYWLVPLLASGRLGER